MNHFRRAWLSISRRKGKSVLLLVVVFVLGNVIAGAVSIQQATARVETNVKNQLGAITKLEFDHEKFYTDNYPEYGGFGSDESEDSEPGSEPEGMSMPTALAPEDITKLAQLPYVKYYDYSVSEYLSSKTLKSLKVPHMEEHPDPQTEAEGDSFTITGVEYPKLLDIEQKRIELVSGSVFSDADIKDGSQKAVISEALAKENGLSVGDQISFTNIVYGDTAGMTDTAGSVPPIVAQRDLALEVIGIVKPLTFESKKKEKKSMQEKMQLEDQQNTLDNLIYVPNKVAYGEQVYYLQENYKANPEEFPKDVDIADIEKSNIGASINPVYVLKGIDDIADFEKEAKPLLPKYFEVKTSTAAYDKIAGPISSLERMSNLVLYIGVGATIIILSLIVVLFLRDRRHELGVYLSLGDPRGKVMLQVAFEVLLIAFVGLTLAVLTGTLVASGVSNLMLNSQEVVAPVGMGDGVFTVSMGDPFDYMEPVLGEEDVVSAYKVTLDLGYVALFYVVGLAVTLISALVPMLYITRLNPKKIMM